VTSSIVTARLELASLSPEFLRLSLAGQADAAAALLGAELPVDWPKGHEHLLQRRLTQLEADPTPQPWLLRAILLRGETLPHPRAPRGTPEGEFGPAPAEVPPHDRAPAPQGPPAAKRLLSGEFGAAFGKVRPLIGLIGFHAPPDANGLVEIGYRILPGYRRHGYATEAAQALLGWATQTHGTQRFKASISPTNEPSLRLIRQLGFHQTGQQHDEIDGLELVFERHAVTSKPYTSDEDTA
jgi:[ribosomal protein S5]-alanine N-acetyltransferase